MKKIILIIFILGNLTSAQDISYNEEFRVDSHSIGWQRNPSTTNISNDKFVICWEGHGQDGSEFGIFAQIFDGQAQKVGSELYVNSYTNKDQENPAITNISENKFVVCWQSMGQDGSGFGIFAQIFDGQGQKIGSEFQVNSYTNGDQWFPSTTNISDNKFVICWQSEEQDGSVDGVFAQIFDDQGQKVGDEFRVNSHTIGDQENPAITNISENKFVVCWQSEGQDGSKDNVYGQIFDDQGQKVGSETLINSYIDNSQENPSITNFQDNNFVVCWQSEKQDGSGFGIFAQIVDNQMQKIGSEFQVNSTTEDNQKRPSITNISDNKFVICWQSGLYNTDIYEQIFDGQGQKIGTEFQVNSQTKGGQTPSTNHILDNKFLVCWSGVHAKYYLNAPRDYTSKNFRNVSPQMDATVNDCTPKFTWRIDNNSRLNFTWEVSYDLYISKNKDFQNPITYSNISDTTYEIFHSLEKDQTYYWKVRAVTWKDDSLWSNEANGFYVSEDAENTDIKNKQTSTPKNFKLHQNHPNPFNPTTNITYDLPPGSGQYQVTIKIYDIQGRLIKVLKKSKQSPGRYTVQWNGIDQSGQKVANGLYIYSIQAGQFTSSDKMLLLK